MVVDGTQATTLAATRRLSKPCWPGAGSGRPQRATPHRRGIGGPLTIKLAPFPLEGRIADVALAVYDRRHTTRGEERRVNSGRMIENFNVVRQLELVDRWTARSQEVDDRR